MGVRMGERRLVLCPDADRFPMGDRDRDLARDANVQLIEIDGHDLSDFRKVGQQVVGCLAWGGRYGMEALDLMPHLRVLARCGSGIDNIDLAAARARGVTVTFVPGASDEEVSDHTIAMILACLRELVASDAAIRRGEWPSAVQLTSMRRVRGTHLGLVGFGRIASAVAAKATCLGMEVSAYDPFISAQSFEGSRVLQVESLIDLLERSDVVSLHVPPSPDGSPIIGPREFRAIRPGAVVINTGRGSLVDESSLVEALGNGRLSGAGLDVFQEEPLRKESALVGFTNVVLTPHSAAFSAQALSDIRQSALSDVVAVLNGQVPTYSVES